MTVRKAVIPAAGLGTRMLPASKAVPKEMLPLIDKPAIQFIVEEAVAAGIRDILIITSRGKSVMEDHFDDAPELENRLAASGKDLMLQELRTITRMANIHYVRQHETRGLGHAVLCAKSFVENEPFAVLYGDDVIMGPSATAELCSVFRRFGKGVLGVKPVPFSDIRRYSSLKIEAMEERIFSVSDMVEKPAPGEEMSNYAILGRCVLPPEIFEILEATKPGAGGEIQLTDAMKVLARRTGMMACEYSGTHYDMGNRLGVIKATIQYGLSHPEISEDLRQYLKEISAQL
jgi:UTP--glucose-1-phosphate uridylyltransferase